MIFFFAQIPEATPDSLGHWLVDAAALAAIFLIILKIKDHFSPKPGTPQPLIIAPQASFADKLWTEQRIKEVEAGTTKRFEHVEAKIEGARIENKHEMQKLRDEAVEGRRGLHKDIEHLGDRLSDKLGNFSVEISNKVGELRGEVRQFTKTGKTTL